MENVAIHHIYISNNKIIVMHTRVSTNRYPVSMNRYYFPHPFNRYPFLPPLQVIHTVSTDADIFPSLI